MLNDKAQRQQMDAHLTGLPDEAYCPHGLVAGVSDYDVWFCAKCEREMENEAYAGEDDIEVHSPTKWHLVCGFYGKSEDIVASAGCICGNDDCHYTASVSKKKMVWSGEGGPW